VSVVQVDGRTDADAGRLRREAARRSPGWVVMLDPIDQS
jgi:hypothetical protein